MKSSRVSTDNNNDNRNKQAAENDLPRPGRRWKLGRNLSRKLHLVYRNDAKERRERERERVRENQTKKNDETEIRC